MRTSRVVKVIETHTAGMPTRIVAGFPTAIPGATMIEKREYIETSPEMISLRNMLMLEPRGHGGQFGAFLTEPVTPGAVAGVVYFNTVHCLEGMCGHGTIGLATALAETGMIHGDLPLEFNLDTPAGVVRPRVNGRNGVVESVTVRNVPCFAFQRDVHVQVPELGDVRLDVGYGGNFYLYVDAADIDIKVRLENLDELSRKGNLIRKAASEQILVPPAGQLAPLKPISGGIMILDQPVHPEADRKNVLLGGDRFDRSPCGTGTSGYMAILHARGQLAVGKEFVNESILGDVFRGRLVEETRVGQFDAIVPAITGSAYIVALHDFLVDPSDPYPEGFKVKIQPT